MANVQNNFDIGLRVHNLGASQQAIRELYKSVMFQQ
jgi:hypothetical protein